MDKAFLGIFYLRSVLEFPLHAHTHTQTLSNTIVTLIWCVFKPPVTSNQICSEGNFTSLHWSSASAAIAQLLSCLPWSVTSCLHSLMCLHMSPPAWHDMSTSHLFSQVQKKSVDTSQRQKGLTFSGFCCCASTRCNVFYCCQKNCISFTHTQHVKVC